MTDSRPTYPALLLALLARVALAGAPSSLPAAQAATDENESYVQITSVSIEPSKIHKVKKPDEATVTVQVLVHGKVPPNSTARIDVATYSAKPPENRVFYPKQKETVGLDKELVIVRFTVQTSPDTVPGNVVVAATIHNVTGVQRIKEPESYEDWRAEVSTAVP